MAKYMVTGALVQVKANTADGGSALVYVYRGGVVDLDATQAEHLTSVGLVEKLADVDTDPVVAAGPAAVAAAVVDAPVRPDEDADEAVWVAFAVRNGLSQDDAEKATREDLIAIFGDQAPDATAKRSSRRKATTADSGTTTA